MFLLASNPSDVAELSNRFAHGIPGGSSEGDFAMNLKPLAISFVLALGFDCSADTLTGTVRDAKGRPVADARVDIATAAPKVGPAMFCPSCYLDCAKWTKTDADGKFVIAKLSPSLKFRLLATAPDMLSAMTKLVDPATENPAITLDPIPAGLPPDRTLSGRVVDAAGRPIAGALISPEGAETRERRWWGLVEGVRPTVSDTDGRFLMILEKPGTVTLVGRVLKAGKPRPGVTMSLFRSPAVTPNRHGSKPFAEVKTDDLGRYAVPGLAAGDGYFFKVHPGDTSDDSGWSHQFPYLQKLRPATTGFVRLPDIRLIDRDQSLSGIVIDPKGNPVSGVTVSAKIADSYIHVSRPEDGPPPWMETDAEGRFDLRQLPNLPIELMAYVRRPEGGTILHPAIARPKRNQSDIRILFDPALTKKPESLTTTAETKPSP